MQGRGASFISGQQPRERAGLLGKLFGVRLLEPSQILQLPSDAGEMLQMRKPQQGPFRFAGNERQQESALVGIQALA